jgi:hypothetical protein
MASERERLEIEVAGLRASIDTIKNDPSRSQIDKWNEIRPLEEKLSPANSKLNLVKFAEDNVTTYTLDEHKAVLGVTSGLKLPTKPLETVSTDLVLEQRAAGLLQDSSARSQHPAGEHMLKNGHAHGFISAVTSAFKDHYPLALRPQHFFLLVAQGVATHVDLNSEEVRHNWVPHEGKKTLEVICDEFSLDGPNDWASVVSGKEDSFSQLIGKSTVPGVAEELAPAFSDTTPVEDIAQKIVVMDICKHYFDFKMSTCCGFPEITLEGTVEDWQRLHHASERLLRRCTSEFAKQWGDALLPLLDKLLTARKGEVDANFWNSMCKRGGTSGSGARTWFNGWFNIFFPYVDRRCNRYCQPYSSDAGYVLEGLVWDKRYGMREPQGCGGPDCLDFGNGMSSAPVEWNFNGHIVYLDFQAGFVGAVQDLETLQIRPQISWFITRAMKSWTPEEKVAYLIKDIFWGRSGMEENAKKLLAEHNGDVEAAVASKKKGFW